MLKTRIITALVGIPLLLGILYIGGFYWTLLFTVMGLVALYEYLNKVRLAGFTPPILAPYALLGILLFREQLAHLWLPLIFITFMVAIILCVQTYPRNKLDDIALGFFGAFYIGFMLSFTLAMQNLNGAFVFMVLTLILTWSADIGGYLFGRLWGKRQLTPLLSPNKTWAGSIGGLVLTVGMACVYGLVWPGLQVHTSQIIILGLVAGIAAQLGDLFASALKRFLGTKDFGYILPGHGGVLDRFDSFLLVVPVVFYWITYLG